MLSMCMWAHQTQSAYLSITHNILLCASHTQHTYLLYTTYIYMHYKYICIYTYKCIIHIINKYACAIQKPHRHTPHTIYTYTCIIQIVYTHTSHSTYPSMQCTHTPLSHSHNAHVHIYYTYASNVLNEEFRLLKFYFG